MNRRVIKIGGSLLDLPDLNDRLQRWLSKDIATVNLLIVGGGEIVEAVRTLDRIHRLEHSFVHWLCVDLLGHTLQLAAVVLPGMQIIRSEIELGGIVARPPHQPLTALVDVRSFYRRGLPNFGLPETWDTTSDSIAAALARIVEADELVLMKSKPASDPGSNFETWADSGLVDRAFPIIANRLRSARIVDLRS